MAAGIISTSMPRRRWPGRGHRAHRDSGSRPPAPRTAAAISAGVRRSRPRRRGCSKPRRKSRCRSTVVNTGGRALGSGAHAPVVSLAVARAARARASFAHGAVPRRHPHRSRRRAGRAGGASHVQGRVLAPAMARHLLAAVGHGRGGRHLVRAGRAAPAAHARGRHAAAGWIFRAAAAADRPVGTVRAPADRAATAPTAAFARPARVARCVLVRRDAGDQAAHPRPRRRCSNRPRWPIG